MESGSPEIARRSGTRSRFCANCREQTPAHDDIAGTTLDLKQPRFESASRILARILAHFGSATNGQTGDAEAAVRTIQAVLVPNRDP